MSSRITDERLEELSGCTGLTAELVEYIKTERAYASHWSREHAAVISKLERAGRLQRYTHRYYHTNNRHRFAPEPDGKWIKYANFIDILK